MKAPDLAIAMMLFFHGMTACAQSSAQETSGPTSLPPPRAPATPPTTTDDEALMTPRQSALRSLQSFLRIEGIAIDERELEARASTPFPPTRNAYVSRHPIREYRTPWGDFDVDDEGAIVEFRAADDRGSSGTVVTQERAEAIARAFMQRHVTWWTTYQLELNVTLRDESRAEFAWHRVPSEGEVAVYRSEAFVAVDLRSGRVISHGSTPLAYARREPVRFDEAAARARILHAYPRCVIDSLALWIEIIGGQFRSVWIARITARGGRQGAMIIRLGYDADTGEIVERRGDDRHADIEWPGP